MSIMGFSGMPYIVMLSENILDIALWVKHSRWPPLVQGQAINSYYFRHYSGSFVFFVSIIGFSGMPYIIVLSEDILDIALWVKNLRWPPFVQGQTINSYYFRHNRGSFVFLVSVMGFLCMPYIMVLSEDILDIALWVKIPRWPPFVQGQAINSYHFSGMLYIVVLSENIFDIALCVKHSIWPPFVQGQAKNSFHFRHDSSRFVFWCLSWGFQVCCT